MCLGEIADRVRRQLDDAERCERAGDAAARPAAPGTRSCSLRNGRRSDDSRRALPLPRRGAGGRSPGWRNCKSYNAHPAMAHISAPSATSACRRPPRRPGAFWSEPPAEVRTPARSAPRRRHRRARHPRGVQRLPPGEDLPYRLLDGFVVCRADDHGAPEAVDREDAEEGADREGTSAAAIEGDIGSDGTLSAPSTSPRLAAFGWVCAPDAKTPSPSTTLPRASILRSRRSSAERVAWRFGFPR